MGFIIFIIVILVISFFYISMLLDKYGNEIFVIILLVAIIFGFILWEHTEYAGESNPFSEIHLVDNKGNIKEIIRMKDGEIVEHIITEEQ